VRQICLARRELMALTNAGIRSFRNERFQEAGGLAQSTCSGTQCSSHSYWNSGIELRGTPESVDSRFHVDPHQHCRGKRSAQQSRIRPFHHQRKERSGRSCLRSDIYASEFSPRVLCSYASWLISYAPINPPERSPRDGVRFHPWRAPSSLRQALKLLRQPLVEHRHGPCPAVGDRNQRIAVHSSDHEPRFVQQPMQRTGCESLAIGKPQ
jgi:hypothetical protein